MILGKLWRTIQAQLHKLVGFLLGPRPDRGDAAGVRPGGGAAPRRPGRSGRVPGVRRAGGPAGGQERREREAAGGHGEDLPRARGDREIGRPVRAGAPVAPARSSPRTKASSRLHEQAYENNLLKIKHAGGNLARDPRQDRPLRRRPQDEQRRGRDGQAGSGVPCRRDHRLRQARVERPGKDRPQPGEGASGRRTSPARVSRPSARKRPPEAQLAEDALREFERQHANHPPRRPFLESSRPIRLRAGQDQGRRGALKSRRAIGREPPKIAARSGEDTPGNGVVQSPCLHRRCCWHYPERPNRGDLEHSCKPIAFRRLSIQWVIHREEHETMAAGQPKPTFYVALALVVLGLIGFAVYRSDIIAPEAGPAFRGRRGPAARARA